MVTKSSENGPILSPSESGIGHRLKAARELRRLSQTKLGSLTGVSKQTILRYEAGGRSLPSDFVEAVAKTLDISIPWLVSGQGAAPVGLDELPPAPRDSTDLPETVDPADVVWIDRFSARPTAGRGGVLDDHRDGRYPLLAELAKQWGHPRVKLGAVRVRGDSMSPTLNDGDYVIVAADPTVRHEVCVVAVRGELWVKRIGIDPASGGLVLISDNTNYPPQIVGPDSDVRIVGPVVKEDRVRRR